MASQALLLLDTLFGAASFFLACLRRGFVRRIKRYLFPRLTPWAIIFRPFQGLSVNKDIKAGPLSPLAWKHERPCPRRTIRCASRDVRHFRESERPLLPLKL